MIQWGTTPVATLSSTSARQTTQRGRTLGRLLRPGDVIGLVGDLGCGKTQLTKGIAEGLGCDPRYRVCSPTFTLINEHPARVPLVHMDLYRLEDVDEMIEIGALSYLGGPAVCVIEWFERCAAYVGVDHLVVSLRWIDERVRQFELFARGDRPEELARCWAQQASRKGR